MKKMQLFQKNRFPHIIFQNRSDNLRQPDSAGDKHIFHLQVGI